MGTAERSKKKVQLYKKAIVHFFLCFVMGFFTGFAPTGNTSIFSSPPVVTSNGSAFSPEPVEVFHKENMEESGKKSLEENLIPKRLIIFVTPTRLNDKIRYVNLMRLSNTLRLVPPPFLWVIVEQKSDSCELSDILRKTGIMYRHLVFNENFTDPEVEMDHQRNLALNHLEQHRLSGIVHFAGLSNVYDLQFFDEIRAIEVFGTWPMALLSANRKRVVIEGPVCNSSEVVGWHVKKLNNLTDFRSSLLHISSFAFNSSILWDPERWGRQSSVKDTTQNMIKFVTEEVLEEETKVMGIPAEGCSKLMLWNLHIPTGITTPNNGIQVILPESNQRSIGGKNGDKILI